MSWPSSQDFNEAVQTPGLAFSDPDLKGGQAAVGATGLPLPRRGFRGRVSDSRCGRSGLGGEMLHSTNSRARFSLSKAIGTSDQGQAAIRRRLRVHDRGSAGQRFVVSGGEDGVGGGLLLNQFVRENIGRPVALDALVLMWSKLSRRLREAAVAHADLQHGNVLLVPGSRPGIFGMKLIDYDGMWVPALANNQLENWDMRTISTRPERAAECTPRIWTASRISSWRRPEGPGDMRDESLGQI